MLPGQDDRRRFLRFLAASPLLLPLTRLAGAIDPSGEEISAPEQALDVFDFEAVARRELPPAHFGYLATGVDDDATLRANREGFARFPIRVRRLIDVRRIDASVKLFGAGWDSPIVLAPAGSQRAFHPDGELAVARAARARSVLQILSTVSSTPVEEVVAAREAPVWYQLYPTDRWEVARALVKRAEAAGCPVLVLTVDLQGGSNRETLARAIRRDARECSACHEGSVFENPRDLAARKPMFAGLDVSEVTTLFPADMTWDYLKRLREATAMPIVLKGIVTREDAEIAVARGVDGLIVSNHGGRGEESGRATIECLPEVVAGARGRIPVLVDSGFRRGTDVFKALALGASAVCIGRPYLWGLGAFGQQGVEAVVEILRRELLTIMRQAGTPTIRDIDRSHLVDRGPGRL
jgi:isopentenyl diphosphate isomerase/L-lactate dehydrogenase-like FMN-dependent dehydrogenase